jgi:hypothetical protein
MGRALARVLVLVGAAGSLLDPGFGGSLRPNPPRGQASVLPVAFPVSREGRDQNVHFQFGAGEKARE